MSFGPSSAPNAAAAAPVPAPAPAPAHDRMRCLLCVLIRRSPDLSHQQQLILRVWEHLRPRSVGEIVGDPPRYSLTPRAAPGWEAPAGRFYAARRPGAAATLYRVELREDGAVATMIAAQDEDKGEGGAGAPRAVSLVVRERLTLKHVPAVSG